ncbi:helix-turn-helix domain-containing protein [Chitinophaga sp. 30R24]|uniref:helix-turn-helix domain-containing protein n=1 Tax=Chitinophaga sp. 30R24 TaxID=3248838 RepID=UPI003B8FCC2D
MTYYNKRFIKLIRKTLHLTQQEMSNLIGIQRSCFAGYESGRSPGSLFFHLRMIELFGIDLRQPPHFHKIVFTDTGKIPVAAYQYLSQVEVYE